MGLSIILTFWEMFIQRCSIIVNENTHVNTHFACNCNFHILNICYWSHAVVYAYQTPVWTADYPRICGYPQTLHSGCGAVADYIMWVRCGCGSFSPIIYGCGADADSMRTRISTLSAFICSYPQRVF